ncbi:MAG: Sec-independent protein translocase protein TatB [Caldilinea sp.]
MDSFFGIGLMELFLIAVIALIVLGPERLPGAMRSVANFMRQIRELSSEFTSQFSEEIKMLEEMDPRRMINEVLDPSKPASSSTKPAVKPATSNTATKSTPAPAKPSATNSPPKNKPEENSILAPKPTEDAPIADAASATSDQPSSTVDGDAPTAAPDVDSPAAAEAER